MCRYTTLWNVHVLKATIEKKTSVTTHFRNLPHEITCLLSQLLSKITVISCSFKSNVKCVCLAAGSRVFSCCFKDTDISQGNVATYLSAVESLVIVLFKIFSWFRRWKQYENWSIFDEVIRRTKICQFLGHTVVGIEKTHAYEFETSE